MKWCRNYKGDYHAKKYMVTCHTLMDELDGYCLNEYEIDVHSWYDDFHNPKFKCAGSFSEHRYKMQFKDKKHAAAVWVWIVAKEPTYTELEKIGFTKSVW